MAPMRIGLLGSIFCCTIFRNGNMILAGNKKFTLSRREVWGSTTQLDNLGDFLSFQIEFVGLVDVEPISMGEINCCGQFVF